MDKMLSKIKFSFEVGPGDWSCSGATGQGAVLSLRLGGRKHKGHIPPAGKESCLTSPDGKG